MELLKKLKTGLIFNMSIVCRGLFGRNGPEVLLQNIIKICAQGPGEEKNVQQEQAGQRQGPVEDRVAVLRGHGPHLPFPGRWWA